MITYKVAICEVGLPKRYAGLITKDPKHQQILA